MEGVSAAAARSQPPPPSESSPDLRSQVTPQPPPSSLSSSSPVATTPPRYCENPPPPPLRFPSPSTPVASLSQNPNPSAPPSERETLTHHQSTLSFTPPIRETLTPISPPSVRDFPPPPPHNPPTPTSRNPPQPRAFPSLLPFTETLNIPISPPPVRNPNPYTNPSPPHFPPPLYRTDTPHPPSFSVASFSPTPASPSSLANAGPVVSGSTSGGISLEKKASSSKLSNAVVVANEAKSPVEEDQQQLQTQIDSSKVISIYPGFAKISVELLKPTELDEHCLVSDNCVNTDDVWVESMEIVEISSARKVFVELTETDFRRTTVEFLEFSSAHKLFVEMPRTGFMLLTALVDGESAMGRHMEFMAISWPFDRGRALLVIREERVLNRGYSEFLCVDDIGAYLRLGCILIFVFDPGIAT